MRMSSRAIRLLHGLCLSVLVLGAAACVAPTPNADRQALNEQDAAGASAEPSSPAPSPALPAPQAEPVAGKKPMRTGGPLPADPVEPVPATPGAVDFSCRSDADCAVKDVGNCCGYYPACVNANSPTDPEGVKAQCAKQGMSSICGFREISACSCRQGRCEASDGQLK